MLVAQVNALLTIAQVARIVQWSEEQEPQQDG
jgi:hypothetical protein